MGSSRLHGVSTKTPSEQTWGTYWRETLFTPPSAPPSGVEIGHGDPWQGSGAQAHPERIAPTPGSSSRLPYSSRPSTLSLAFANMHDGFVSPTWRSPYPTSVATGVPLELVEVGSSCPFLLIVTEVC